MSSTQEVGEIFGAGSGPAHAMMRSPTVLIAAIGLFGMNVFFFRVFQIDYVKVLKHDLLKLESVQDPGKDRFLHPTGASHNNATNASLEQQQAALQQEASDSDYYGYEEDEYDTDGDDNAVTWTRLVGLSMTLLFILHASYFWWIDIMGGGSIGAVFCFYGACIIAILFPLPQTRWLRKAAVLVLQRSFELINPRCSCVQPDNTTGPRSIPFVDVFFADAMCSLSKVFFDWGLLFHMATHYPDPVPPSTHNILIPSAFAAVPYLIRARQCLIMYTVTSIRKDANRNDNLWNALKYSTSIFPLLLSAFQKTVSAPQAAALEPYLIALLLINALYALYWDVVMDWGMMKNVNVVSCKASGSSPGADQPRAPSCGHALLRTHLRFGLSMSALILVADSVLRFGWVLRFYHDLFPSADSFALCTQFLEVFRRSLWNLLRVEWENLKHLKAMPAVLELKVEPPIDETSGRGHHSGRNSTGSGRSKSEEEMAGLLTHREGMTPSTNG